MNSLAFVRLVKQEAVDSVVALTLKRLSSHRVPAALLKSNNPFHESIAAWVQTGLLAEQRRSEWFNRLPDEERHMVRTIVESVAELAVLSVFTTIDGVGGPYEGVFEVIAVDADNQRTLVNAQNTEMLHDLFSEVCERDRRQ